jgi:DNA-binding response OmpR family regulator
MPQSGNVGGNQMPGAMARGDPGDGYILVIDDEEAILDILVAILRDDEGYQVYAVRAGHEALQVAPETVPAFIMLDVTLPNEKAEEIVRLLRSRPGWKGVPFVICSAIPRLREVAAELGAAGWLAKPFELQELIATARRFAGPAAPSTDREC